MALGLHNLKPAKGAKRKSRRVGRGLGSKGAYSGRGIKGQRSRSGGKSGLKLKGIRKIMLSTPKVRGFKSGKPKAAVVNVSNIASRFDAGSVVTPAALVKAGLVPSDKNGVKVLGNGAIGIKVTVKGCQVSESARKKITEAGGTVADKA